MTTTMTGQCLCGGVRFAATNVEVHHHACHCGMCRRWSGGPFLAAAAESVNFETTGNLARYASSEWAERGFCATCGSSLFYFLKPTGQYMLSVGAFNDSAPFQLAAEIYIDHKPQGYAFAGDHPRQTEAQVLAQFAAAAGGGSED